MRLKMKSCSREKRANWEDGRIRHTFTKWKKKGSRFCQALISCSLLVIVCTRRSERRNICSQVSFSLPPDGLFSARNKGGSRKKSLKEMGIFFFLCSLISFSSRGKLWVGCEFLMERKRRKKRRPPAPASSVLISSVSTSSEKVPLFAASSGIRTRITRLTSSVLRNFPSQDPDERKDSSLGTECSF